MNTDNNQNKQLTELSEEELKQVTGGVGQWLAHDQYDILCISKIPEGDCPIGAIEKDGQCCPA